VRPARQDASGTQLEPICRIVKASLVGFTRLAAPRVGTEMVADGSCCVNRFVRAGRIKVVLMSAAGYVCVTFLADTRKRTSILYQLCGFGAWSWRAAEPA